MPPWEVLDMPLTSALDVNAVRRAFQKKARTLAPKRNLGCIETATREYVAARRARDALLMLADVNEVNSTEETKKMPLEQRQAKSTLGARVPLLVALKLAIYRIVRDHKTKIARSWWSRVSGAFNGAINFPTRLVRSALRFCRAHTTLLLMASLSLVAIPAMALA